MATRSFGTIISANRGRGCELSDAQRGYILGRIEAGAKGPKLARELGCDMKTIYDTINRVTELATTKSRVRNGAPRKIDERDKRRIINEARRKPAITYKALQEVTGLNISRTTFYRVLKEEGIKDWLRKKRVALTPDLARTRLHWARRNAHTDWTKVAFSDECSIESGSGHKREWVFRYHNEAYLPEMVDPISRSGTTSQMVWGAFSGNTKSQLVVMTRDPTAKKNGYTARSYIHVLEDQLDRVCPPESHTFQQDNAPIHKARVVTEWFENHGYTVMDWPPYSPDMNPIENMWFHLKEVTDEVHPGLASMPGSNETVQAAIGEAAEQAWDLIEWSRFNAVIEGMPRRVQALLDAEGCYTKY